MEVRKASEFSADFNALAVNTQKKIKPILRKIYQELRRIAFIEEINTDKFDIGTESTDKIEGVKPGDTIFGIRLSDAYVLYLAEFGTAVTTCNLLTIGYVARD